MDLIRKYPCNLRCSYSLMRNEPSSIGLRRGIVQLRAYDPAWAEAFCHEAARLAQRVADAGLPPLLFEHIGSTAVPGLEAKPIIDLIAGHQRGIERRAYVLTLEAAGYELRGPQGLRRARLALSHTSLTADTY